MWKRLATWLAIAFPLLLGAAMVWYAWPRTGPSPHEGSLVTMHYVRLMWAATELLLLYWGVTLLLFLRGAAAAPGSGARTAGLVSGALAVVSVAGILALWSSGSWITGWYLLVVACWSSAVLSGCYRSLRGWSGRGVVFLVVLVIVTLVLLPAAAVLYYGADPWVDTAQLRLSDGRVFHLQRNRRGDMFDSEEQYLLTREVSRGAVFLKTQLITYSYGIFADALIVRPVGAVSCDLKAPRFPSRPGRDKSVGRLVVGRDGMILFIYPYVGRSEKLSGCATNLAYDPDSGISLSDDGLRVVSPFVLIGPRDALNRDDLIALLHYRLHYRVLPPSAEILLKDSAHPNPRVREAVVRMLPSYEYPVGAIRTTLATLAAHDPDPDVRKAARASLSKLKASDAKGTP